MMNSSKGALTRTREEPPGRPGSAAGREDLLIHELLGLLKGVLLDRKVNLDEANGLLAWLEANHACRHRWPAGVLYERLQDCLFDNALTPDEADDLYGIMLQIASPSGDITEKSPTTLPISPPPWDVQFEGKSFCFTGVFDSGTRRQCHAAVERLGGRPIDHFVPYLDYLVIGNVASSGWAHSSYGRKIEMAIAAQARGENITIITEQIWVAEMKKLEAARETASALATQVRHVSVDPEKYFRDWAYDIRPALWGSVGVTPREAIDSERQQSLRAVAMANGATEAEARRIKATKQVIKRTDPPRYDFHDGDIFYANPDGSPSIQVVGRVSSSCFEVHAVMRPDSRGCSRHAYHLTDEQLASWLETGSKPDDTYRIGRSASQSALWELIIEPLQESPEA